MKFTFVVAFAAALLNGRAYALQAPRSFALMAAAGLAATPLVAAASLPNCVDQLPCFKMVLYDVTAAEAAAAASCDGYTGSTCVKKLCMEFDYTAPGCNKAADDTISHMCDAADGSGCRRNAHIGSAPTLNSAMDSPDNAQTTAPFPDFSMVKYDGVPSGERMCMYVDPGSINTYYDVPAFLLKDGSDNHGDQQFFSAPSPAVHCGGIEYPIEWIRCLNVKSYGWDSCSGGSNVQRKERAWYLKLNDLDLCTMTCNGDPEPTDCVVDNDCDDSPPDAKVCYIGVCVDGRCKQEDCPPPSGCTDKLDNACADKYHFDPCATWKCDPADPSQCIQDDTTFTDSYCFDEKEPCEKYRCDGAGDCVYDSEHDDYTPCVVPECSPFGNEKTCLAGCCLDGVCVPADEDTDGDGEPECARVPCEVTPGLCDSKDDDCAEYECIADASTHIDPEIVDQDGCYPTPTGTGSEGCCDSCGCGCNTDSTDCLDTTCSAATAYQCEYTPVNGGQSCGSASSESCCDYWGNCIDDENVCGLLQCPDKPASWPVEPDVNYVPGNLETDYTIENLEKDSPGPPICLTFESNAGELVDLDSNDDIDPDDLVFAALIYDDGTCTGDIIGMTADPDPHLAIEYRDGYVNPYAPTLPWTPTIDDSDPNAPKLLIDALPLTFKNEFYYQDLECSDEFGDTTDPTNSEAKRCGQLLFCVEFQVLDKCGNKLDFVDVQIQVEFELIEKCELDFCGEIRFQRDPVVIDGEDIDIGKIECYPCKGAIDPTVGLPAIQVGQGQAVELCINAIPDVTGVCVYKILKLDLEVSRPVSGGGVQTVTYPAIPGGLYLVDFPLVPERNNPDYRPYYPTGSIEIPVNEDDATVNVLMPAAEFQEVNPVDEDGECRNPPCEVTVLIRGKVLLGLGTCYCADPYDATDDDCELPPGGTPGGSLPLPSEARRHRHLQRGQVGTTAEAAIVQEVVFQRSFEAETDVGCGGLLDVGCWVMQFLASLLSFLSFGLLGG